MIFKQIVKLPGPTPSQHLVRHQHLHSRSGSADPNCPQLLGLRLITALQRSASTACSGDVAAADIRVAGVQLDQHRAGAAVDVVEVVEGAVVLWRGRMGREDGEGGWGGKMWKEDGEGGWGGRMGRGGEGWGGMGMGMEGEGWGGMGREGG